MQQHATGAHLFRERDEAEWKRLASAAFGSWFPEEEYEYPGDG